MSESELPSSATRFTVRGEPVRYSPLALRQRQFRAALFGLNRDEVILFLNEVADDYDRVLRHIETLEDEIARLEVALAEHRERESTLRNTLVTAQKLADEVRDAAQKEAHIIVREAESRTDLLLEKAQSRLEEIERHITELRQKRRSVEGAVESFIGALQHALDVARSHDRADREERILLHRPRPTEDQGRTSGSDAPPAARRAEWDD